MACYDLTPVDVPAVETQYRRIQTRLPVPESLPIFEQLHASEPRSMQGQPPVVWDRAEGFTVADKWGNRWLDWSSCVLGSNAGPGRPEIRAAVTETAEQGLLATYVFAHERRAALVRALQALAPEPERYRVFLLSTGSEAIENCIKLSKTWARQKHGAEKRYVITFDNAFHGRTLGAQLAGGIESQKEWIGDRDPTFVQVPFPDGFRNEDTRFDLFLETIDAHGIAPEQIAGVMAESYQGCGPNFFPVEYAQQLERFCREHDIVLALDEVQAGFGRSGKMFTYEHYGIQPDLIACGKGVSSSLPLAAVMGRADILDLHPPGSMTSTHSASPLCVAAALANLEVLQQDELVAHAAAMGHVLVPELRRIAEKHADRLACVHGEGLVAGIQCVRPGTVKPDAETALAVNLGCFHRGLLMFAPVGVGNACIKIAPPLVTPEDALREGIAVLEQACAEVLHA